MNYKKFLLAFLFIFPLLSAYPAEEASSIDILFFNSSHCKACLRVKNEILPPLKDKYGDKIKILSLPTTDQDNLNRLIALASVYAEGDAKIPAVFCGETLIIGRTEIEKELDGLIEYLLTRRKITFSQSLFTDDLVEKEFRTFSILTIVAAGLLDGINPCAFTVIVFFMSFLACYKYTKKDIVVIGLAYIVAIFITYILIGLGLFRFLYALSNFYQAMKIFYMAIAWFCILLSLLCLYDYLRFRKSRQPSESLLQLPPAIKLRIHKIIGQEFRKTQSKQRRLLALILGALSVGFMVSILEAVCTGQVYLPIITFVLKLPSLRLRALFYLILYNLMFIMPLVVVFLFALWGTTSLEFAQFLQKRFGLIRIGMAILFAGLGIFLIYSS